MVVEPNAAALYGYHLDALWPVGDRIGPVVAAAVEVVEVVEPLAVDDYPTDSTCSTFDRRQVLRSGWATPASDATVDARVTCTACCRW